MVPFRSSKQNEDANDMGHDVCVVCGDRASGYLVEFNFTLRNALNQVQFDQYPALLILNLVKH